MYAYFKPLTFSEKLDFTNDLFLLETTVLMNAT